VGISDAQPVLQFQHQVDDLRLHRDIERRDRLVRDDQRRRQRTPIHSGMTGNGSSYPLAIARSLMTSRFPASVNCTRSKYGNWFPTVATA
jgi:hypothetical protein